MAIKIIANYSKRLGLPGYSSHQFSVTAETELVDLGQVQGESTRLYGLLQDAVDREIQEVGFVPDESYGMRQVNTPPRQLTNGTGRNNQTWECSDKQKDLILKLVSEHQLDPEEVDQLARQRFGKGVRELNKIEASGLIDELLEVHGGKQARANGRRSAYAGSNGKGGRR